MSLFSRLREHKALRYAGIAAASVAAILAVAIVSSLAVDLGPMVRTFAEREASRELSGRPVHIGGLKILVARGLVEATDFSIDGLKPNDRQFLTAKRLLVALDWSHLLRRRPEFVITSAELTDWQMSVERWSDSDNFPKLRKRESSGSTPGRRPYVVTLTYFRAWRGQFSYEDHETPWSVFAPNLDINVTKLANYHGDATFNGGTLSVLDFVPMWTNLKVRFDIEDGMIHVTRADIETDGAQSQASGFVDVAHFPEMTYAVKSRLHAARVREIFFQSESWKLLGDADFTGTFHLFKGGHDLAGSFTSALFGIYDYRFPSVYGSLHWTRKLFEIWNAGSQFYGGSSTFAFSTKPLGEPAPGVARLEFGYRDVDVAQFTDFEALAGQRFAGRAAGRNLLEWRLGHFGDNHHGDGDVAVTPPSGVDIMGASLAAARAADPEHSRHEWGPFAPMLLGAHMPISGEMTYRYDPAQIDIQSGRFASERTYVTFQGTSEWGRQGRLPFHVTSRDWQESDQLLAGIMTDVASRTGIVTVGGRGEFDGVMTGPFRSPRVEGRITGEDVRAWDTLWGSGSARIVVEDNYVTVADGIICHDDSEIRSDGLFSLQFPRADGKQEMDARFRSTRGDVVSLRHAFQIDDYPISGELTGELHLTGLYHHPVGFGAMSIDHGVAYGEPLGHGESTLRFDGNGMRLDGLTLAKGTGGIAGAAYVGWDSTYSFNVDARRIPVDAIDLFAYPKLQPTGFLDFTADGSGIFDVPQYDVKFRVDDLLVSGEPVGQMTGTLAVRGKELSGAFDAASPHLAVTGTGRVSLTPQADSELSFRFHDLALDPYARLFMPKLSPFNTAVASGSVRVVGELANMDHLLVDGQVDSLELRLFDYTMRNASPVRLALDHETIRLDDFDLVGEDTRLRVAGSVGLVDDRIGLQAAGEANLDILQGFFHDVRGSGRAELVAAVNGKLHDPVFSGSATIANGRIRHFALPNSLDDINGTIQFDSRGIRLDDVRATMGQGRVQFGGRIGLDGYLPGDFNVTVHGEAMHLRVPQGVRSTVDADLSLHGNYSAPTLSGTVTVKDATFNRRIEPTAGLFDFGARGGGVAGGGAEGAPVSTLPLRFDVELFVPSTLRIENNLARLVASADLQLRGTYDRPQLFGRAQVDRGEVTFEGRRYLVTKGTIDFTNQTRIEPFFDVVAETRVRVPSETYRITIHLTGTTAQLQPTLSSDPPLPSATDILALLFSDVRRNQSGQPGDTELDALKNPTERQTDIMTTRATQLLANPISSQVGRVVEQTFGVDTFQLSPSLVDPYSQTATTRVSPSARVTIGKRISDRVYLTFSRSLASSFNDQILLLEFDESDRFSWILSRNEDDQSYAIELNVRHSF